MLPGDHRPPAGPAAESESAAYGRAARPAVVCNRQLAQRPRRRRHHRAPPHPRPARPARRRLAPVGGDAARRHRQPGARHQQVRMSQCAPAGVARRRAGAVSDGRQPRRLRRRLQHQAGVHRERLEQDVAQELAQEFAQELAQVGAETLIRATHATLTTRPGSTNSNTRTSAFTGVDSRNTSVAYYCPH